MMIGVLLLRYWHVVVIAGLLLTLSFERMQVSSLKADLLKSKTNEQLLMDANSKNSAAIAALQGELKKASEVCSSRLIGKDKVIKRLQEIDSLKTKKESVGEKNVLPVSGDPLLDELNRVFDSQAGSSTDRVR